ncbi:MAG: hypothetical protein HXX09_04525 [Bacteroidetes bacterium]|nr:hypothetical protein [Bacteroidota bacterium]
MKKVSLFIGIFAILFSSLSIAQTSKEVTFIFKKAENNKIFKKVGKDQKTADFEISGLANSEVSTFIEKVKKFDGVISFTIAPMLNANNNRNANFVVFQRADKNFLRKMLLTVGVNNVIIDGKKVPTSSLGEKASSK